MGVKEVQGKPGRLFIEETGKEVEIRDRRFGSKYDSVSINAGAMAAGTALEFFRDLGGKTRADSNFQTPNRLNSGELMWIHRVGIYIRSANGNIMVPVADIKRVADDSTFRVELNDLLLIDGVTYESQSGYGFYGSDAGAAGIAAVGVPSLGAALMLPQPQFLTPEATVTGRIEFLARNWTAGQNLAAGDQMPIFTGAVTVTCHLWGEILRATTKG
jgi:hypothetical protein